jgi:hypothetical protein
VTDGDGPITSDHADWADAMLVCEVSESKERVRLFFSRIAVLLPLILFADLGEQIRSHLKLGRRGLAALFLLISLLVAQTVLSMRFESLTYDESAHIGAGYAYLTEGEWRIGGREGMAHFPLVRSLSALPLTGIEGIGFNEQKTAWLYESINRLGNELVYGNPQKTEAIISSSRIMIVTLSALLGLYVFLWSARLWGTNAGFLSLLLYAFNPMILAHSKLVTIDIGCSLFFFAAVFYLWNYLKNPSTGNLLLSGISLGLGIVTKITGLMLIPLIILIIIAASKRKNRNTKTIFSRIASLALISLLIVNATYGFKDVLRPLGSFKLTSGFSGIAKTPYLKRLPVPLPEPFILGLDYGLSRSEQGHLTYFFGEVMSKGVWYYYVLLFLIKNPIPLLLLLVVSVLYCRNYRKELVNNVFLLLPAILIFIVLSRGHVNIGLRYALPAFPFIFVYLGRLATCRRISYALYILCFFYVLSAFSIYPHYLAVVSDLDWGQDMKGLAEYVRQRNITNLTYSKYGTAPADYYGLNYKLLQCEKTEGFIAIHAINLMRNPKCNGWLMNYTPAGKIGHSIFLYNISS